MVRKSRPYVFCLSNKFTDFCYQQKIAIGQLEIYLCLCALSLTIDVVSDKERSKLKDAILIWLTKVKLLIN